MLQRAHMKALLFTLTTIILASCASTPPAAHSSTPSLTDTTIPGSSIEITYLRGMNSHSFVLEDEAKTETGRIQFYRDHHLLKEIHIPKAKYSELAKESSGILVALERHPAQQKPTIPCRTPFSLKMKDVHEIKSIEGCRSSDEGAALGKLIKDVEFMMFSTN